MSFDFADEGAVKMMVLLIMIMWRKHWTDIQENWIEIPIGCLLPGSMIQSSALVTLPDEWIGG